MKIAIDANSLKSFCHGSKWFVGSAHPTFLYNFANSGIYPVKLDILDSDGASDS